MGIDSECMQKDWPLLENSSVVTVGRKVKKTIDADNLIFGGGKSDGIYFKWTTDKVIS